MITAKEFWTNIRIEAARKDLSLRQVAVGSGIVYSGLYRTKNLGRYPTSFTAHKMAKVLGVTVDYLCNRTAEWTPKVKLNGFREKFRYLMADKTQAEVADIIGVTRGSVNNYANGYSLPALEPMIKIADAFGCSIDWLMEDE